MNAADIAGYTYQAENYTPEKLIDALVAAGLVDLDSAAQWSPERILDTLAQARGIDRQDQHSFDSGDFPKVIFVDQLDPDYDSDWYDFG